MRVNEDKKIKGGGERRFLKKVPLPAPFTPTPHRKNF